MSGQGEAEIHSAIAGVGLLSWLYSGLRHSPGGPRPTTLEPPLLIKVQESIVGTPDSVSGHDPRRYFAV